MSSRVLQKVKATNELILLSHALTSEREYLKIPSIDKLKKIERKNFELALDYYSHG